MTPLALLSGGKGRFTAKWSTDRRYAGPDALSPGDRRALGRAPAGLPTHRRKRCVIANSV